MNHKARSEGVKKNCLPPSLMYDTPSSNPGMKFTFVNLKTQSVGCLKVSVKAYPGKVLHCVKHIGSVVGFSHGTGSYIKVKIIKSAGLHFKIKGIIG